MTLLVPVALAGAAVAVPPLVYAAMTRPRACCRHVCNREELPELPQRLRWRHVYQAGLHPLSLVKTFGKCFDRVDLCMLQLFGIGIAGLCAGTGLDWAWVGRFRPLPAWAVLWASVSESAAAPTLPAASGLAQLPASQSG